MPIETLVERYPDAPGSALLALLETRKPISTTNWAASRIGLSLFARSRLMRYGPWSLAPWTFLSYDVDNDHDAWLSGLLVAVSLANQRPK